MMNKLSVIQTQNTCKTDFGYSDLALDNIVLDEWLSGFVDDIPRNFHETVHVKGLALSLDLFAQDEMQLVWYLLGHLKAEDTKIVPLLVCPDDLDLNCTVVVAEQVVTETHVTWQRFGFDTQGVFGKSRHYKADDIDWFSTVPHVMFTKDNFIQVFNMLKDAIIESHKKHGQKITIVFPAEQDRKPTLAKEDWELELDSWYD